MAILNLSVDDELEKKFRDAAGLYFGNKKGNLSKAATEAFDLWLQVRACCKEANVPVQNAVTLLTNVIQRISEKKDSGAG